MVKINLKGTVIKTEISIAVRLLRNTILLSGFEVLTPTVILNEFHLFYIESNMINHCLDMKQIIS